MDWSLMHSDAYHPGSRNECAHCQEMIKIYGPMPSINEILRQESARTKTAKLKARIPDAIRWEVWERDDFRCIRCGMRRYLTVDHIFPESLGGTLESSNLQTLCRSCNSSKGTKIQ
jgi:5-methylcytosine-specific restriction endonuclease McrA